jgi:glycerol-3-phosphate dehydrogenase
VPCIYRACLVAWQEYACTLVDIIARRTRLAFLDASACQDILPELAAEVGKRLNWNKKQIQAEIDNATEFLKTMV